MTMQRNYFSILFFIRRTRLLKNGEIKPIERWKNVEFNDQQKADYVAGKTVKLEKVVDAQGKEATIPEVQP